MISIKGESKINFLPYLIFTLVTSCKSLNDLTFFRPFSDSYIQVNLENILYVFSKKAFKTFNNCSISSLCSSCK